MRVSRVLKSSFQVAAFAPLWWTNGALVKRRLKNASPAEPRSIRRVNDANLAEVMKEDEPVIIEGYLRRFEFFSLYQPQVMKRAFADVELPVFVNRADDRGFEQDNRLERIRYDDFIDAVYGQSRPTDVRYYTRWGAPSVVSKLELSNVPAGRPIDHCNLWMGHEGNITTVHCDVWNGFLGMTTGRKQVSLFPPDQIFALYPQKLLSRNYNSLRQTRLPDDFHAANDAEFPNVRRSIVYEDIIGPGDLLYIPPQWWHQVISLDSAISVAFRYAPSLREFVRPASLLIPWRQLLDELGISKLRDLHGELADPWSLRVDPEQQSQRYLHALRAARDASRLEVLPA